MGEESPPPNIIDPFGRAVWNVLNGSGGPLSKINDQIDKIKVETKSMSDLNDTFTELNSTLKDTNRILQEFLGKI